MELWDVYDENGKLTGRTISRVVGGAHMPEGECHLAVTVVILDSAGETSLREPSGTNDGEFFKILRSYIDLE